LINTASCITRYTVYRQSHRTISTNNTNINTNTQTRSIYKSDTWNTLRSSCSH